MDGAVRIRHVDDITLMGREAAAFHGEGRFPLLCIAAHGLVNHDGMDIFFLNGLLSHDPGAVHSAFEAAVLKEILFSLRSQPLRNEAP